MGHFGPKNGTYSELWIGSKNFLKILLNERANRYLKILLVVFLREKFIWVNLIFLAFRPFFTVWLGMVKLSQATVDWILKQSCHDFFHDYYWILKQSVHDYDF